MLLVQSLLPFRFHSNPGPQTTRPSCHFLGLSENASSFSGQKKNVRSVRVFFFFFPFFGGVHGSHIPNWKQKGTTRRWQMSSTDHSLRFPLSAAPPVDVRRQLQNARTRSSRGRGEGVSTFGLTQAVKTGRLAGLFRPFPKAAWWRSRCLIHRWP